MEDIDDLSAWSSWRTGPIPFPTFMRPPVPETLDGGPPLDFGRYGADLTIILPPSDQNNRQRRALWLVAEWIHRKARNAVMATPDNLADESFQRHLILLGTPQDNSIARQLVTDSLPGFFDGVCPGGYHIKVMPHPAAKERKAILALGSDEEGAWRAATILFFSIHPQKTGRLDRWSPDLPDGTYWAPFEASCSEGSPPPAPSVPAPEKVEPPRIPFGVRSWGSPTPTLATYERLVQALRPYEINTIALFPGGWQDIAHPGEVCRAALDAAYRAGIFTVLYVGNDTQSHRPAPLTPKHKAIVEAVKDHPGLLAWRLYNQLTDELSEPERRMLREQIEWLQSVSDKPVGMEVVWGHSLGAPPEHKVRLIEDLRSWGVKEIEHDCAPIGGWSRSQDTSLWETRIQSLHKMNVIPWAVPQAHVPFKVPTLPTPAEIRNQFWWCAAAGARGFLFEAAYNFNHFSNRGLFTWTLQPVPDGRPEEIRNLARIARRLEEMLLTSRPANPEEIARLGGRMEEGAEKTRLRIRQSPGNVAYLVLINTDLNAPVHAECSFDGITGPCTAAEVAPGEAVQVLDKGKRLAADLLPGGGACFRLNWPMQ